MMRLLFVIMIGIICHPIHAQEVSPPPLPNFPIILSFHFSGVAMPFKDLKSLFSNIGVGIGTSRNWGNQSRFFQTIELRWWHNKAMGNRWLLDTELHWNPKLRNTIHGDLHLGVGYLWAKRPVKSYQPMNGTWVERRKKGKGMVAVPMGIGLRRLNASPAAFRAWGINYTIVWGLNFNPSIPILPEHLLVFDSTIDLRD